MHFVKWQIYDQLFEKFLLHMPGLQCKMVLYSYDVNHGYRKEMMRENVCCITYSCQFIKSVT